MKKLQEQDILFLLKKTKLSLKQLINLIEDERDYNLVIHAIAANLTEKDKKLFPKLSDKLRLKLALYHSSQDVDYDINEKSYISEILCRNYNYIYKYGYILNKNNNKEIKELLSVIKNNKLNNNIINNMAVNLGKIGYRDVAFHLPKWIEIINKSKEILV